MALPGTFAGAGADRGASIERHVHFHGGRDAGRRVALTFDDGPGPRTAEIAGRLESAGARGTFFMVGNRLAGASGLLAAMIAAGHELGNHSFEHPVLPGIEEILATSELLESCAGRRPVTYRPPFGEIDVATAERVRAEGLAPIRWDVSSEDVFPVWEGATPEQIYVRVVASVMPGSIVLLHDGCPWTEDSVAAAVPAIVAALQTRGYELVTVTELLAGTATGAPTGSRPDDAGGLLARIRRPRQGRKRPELVPARGRFSPLTRAEIDGMDLGELLSFLRDWRPGPGEAGDPAAGLARQVTSRLTVLADEALERREAVAGLPRQFFEAAVAGIEQAVSRLDRPIDWGAALDLLASRAAVASSVESRSLLALCLAGERVGPDHAAQIADVIADLAGERERSNRAEGRRETVPALIAAIAWARRNGLADQAREWSALLGEWIAGDPGALGVRATAGSLLAAAEEASPGWTAANLDLLFPADAGEQEAWRASWEGYVCWNSPTPALLAALERPYLRAFGEAWGAGREIRSTQSAEVRDPEAALGRHVAALHLSGAAPLDGPLLSAFFDTATPRRLEALVKQVGHTLAAPAAPDADGTMAGLALRLWERIESRLEGAPLAARRTALAPVGLWLASGALPASWCRERLAGLLAEEIAPSSAYRVARALLGADAASGDPELVDALLAIEPDPALAAAVRRLPAADPPGA